MHLVMLYECEGGLSLDKKFLEDIADGKFKAERKLALINDFDYKELTDAYKNNFDLKLYRSYLNDGDEENSYDYMQKYGKSIPKHDTLTFDNKKEFDEYLEERNL